MVEKGAVSFWVGQARSQAALRAALEVRSSEDGDFLGSDFSREFQIEYYDEDYLEAVYRDASTTDLAALLKGASYEHVLVDRFRVLGRIAEPANCFISLFDLRYPGTVKSTNVGGLTMRFVGVVSYE